MTPLSNRRRKLALFTVSLVLFLGLLFLLWNAGRIPPQPTACQTNLYLLDQAITQWATNSAPTNFNIPPDNAIRSYFPDGIIPACTDGHAYQRGSLALASTCPKHGVAQYHSPGNKLVSAFQLFLWRRGVPGASTNVMMQCRNNLHLLHAGGEQWSLENQKTNGDRIDTLQAISTLHTFVNLPGMKTPLCPAGGKYSYSYVSNFPCCTITGHTLP